MSDEHWPGEHAVEVEEAREEGEDTGEGPAAEVAVETEPEAEPQLELEAEPEQQLTGHELGRAGIRAASVGVLFEPVRRDFRDRHYFTDLEHANETVYEACVRDRAHARIELRRPHAVPGAFELPLGAMALAKTRRYVAIVALGCVIRGETAHFEYVAGEAASGLQLAALETGVPVAFGVLTTDTLEQAMARADKGAEAVRTALEMADLFNQIRATAKAS